MFFFFTAKLLFSYIDYTLHRLPYYYINIDIIQHCYIVVHMYFSTFILELFKI